MSQVEPGDRVLHWQERGAPRGLVGWSEVEEHATVIPEYTWTPRHGEERTTLGWCCLQSARQDMQLKCLHHALSSGHSDEPGQKAVSLPAVTELLHGTTLLSSIGPAPPGVPAALA